MDLWETDCVIPILIWNCKSRDWLFGTDGMKFDSIFDHSLHFIDVLVNAIQEKSPSGRL